LRLPDATLFAISAGSLLRPILIGVPGDKINNNINGFVIDKAPRIYGIAGHHNKEILKQTLKC
jgi:hypothetical protein